MLRILYLLTSLLWMTTAYTVSTKTYRELEFLKKFGGLSDKVVLEILGKPIRREYAVKPSNADEMLAGRGKFDPKSSKIEIWYYKNLVSYEKNKNYLTTELTFVDGKCRNIAFFNK